MNDEPVANCKAYGFKIQHQLKELGLSECVAKAAAYSPAGDLSCVPADIPGSPHHKDDDGLPTGRLACFKMVGGFHGGVDDDRACATATAKKLAKKLEPLDVMDRARETEYVTHVGQLKHNILRYSVAPIAGYAAQITEPTVAKQPLLLAQARIRRSWEAAVAADASPQALCDDAWRQTCLPSEGFGGMNISDYTCDEDESGQVFNYSYSATFLNCWLRLRNLVPDLYDTGIEDADAPRFVKEAVTGYTELRSRRRDLEVQHERMDKEKYHTVRGGVLKPYRPPALPTSEALPAIDKMFDPTSKLHAPAQGKLAAVSNIYRWHQHLDAMHARDARTAANPAPGDSAVQHREASRFIAVSQPYAGAWHAVPPDSRSASKLATPLWQSSMQRCLGLHLAAAKPALLELAELGETVDFFGDAQVNSANANRRHNGGLRGWYNAIAAVATTQIVLGDKDNRAKTKQFNDYNDGYVVDIAEIAAGDSGEDVCNEFKCFTACKKGRTAGTRGAPASVGHIYGFGNTEEQCRLDNLGCKPRGRACDGPFNHKTGKGHVKGVKGFYHDAQFKKRNRVEVLLHENFGGGFSPPAAYKIRRLGRVAKSGTDRTPYRGGKTVSYVSYHTRDIAMAMVKADAWSLHHAAHDSRARLCALRAAAPAAHA